METGQRKTFLIKRMLEAKEVEINLKKSSLVYKIKNLFAKGKNGGKRTIELLKKTLEKKETEELENMLLEKEENLLLLEKKVKVPEEKEKIKQAITLVNEIKNKEGKREKIGRAIGFKKEEIIKLEKEIEKKEKSKKIIQKIKTPENEEKGIKKIIGKKSKKTTGKKETGTKKASKKKKGSTRKRIKKIAKKSVTDKKEKDAVSFITPAKELKTKKNEETNQKRQKAMEAFHKEFTSGKDRTFINIKGETRIITGKPERGGEEREEYLPPRTAKPAEREINRQEEEIKERKKAEEIEFEIKKTKEKMKNLKAAFFHRQINEEDYKKKLFEYQEELNSLEMEKKRPKIRDYLKTEDKPVKYVAKKRNYEPAPEEQNYKPDYKQPAQKKSAPKTVQSLQTEPELRTVQNERTETAIRHTEQSSQNVQDALKKFRQDFTSAPRVSAMPIEYQPVAEETKMAKPTGIIKRIAPTTSDKKADEMETKLMKMMQKRNIDENQLRKELEFVSSADLIKRFDKILDTIERKYPSTESKKLKDNIFEETTFVTNKKTKAKKEGQIKEITGKKIVTDFDRLLGLVNEKGEINEKEAVKILKLSPERIKECYRVLEKNELVKAEYPMFGGVKIMAKNYVKPKKTKKKWLNERKSNRDI